MKKFILYWLDGRIEVIYGNTIAEAFTLAGYSQGASNALDWYEEVNS